MSSPIRPPLLIETIDKLTSARPINTIKVSNGDLTVSGTTATIDTSGSGGGGTVTSVTSTDAFINVATTTTTPVITIQDATTAQDGVLTSTDWNTFNNKGSGTITGSITDTEVAFGDTTADSIQGSSNFTFDGSNLYVSGYIKVGGGAAGITTTGATDLVLTTNTGTSSGSITITDGVDGGINVAPNGTGFVTLGNYKFDVDQTVGAGQDEYVLTYDHAAASISLAAGGGGGTVTSVTGTLPISSTGGTTPALSISQSATAADGYLSSTDWNTFNNKGSGTVTSVTGTLPISSSGGATPALSISQSATAADGYLSSADWNTFDGKQDTLSLTTTGTSGAATLVGATLNVPQYAGGGTFSGSLADTQVAFGNTTADSIQGSSSFTYDNTNKILAIGAGTGTPTLQSGSADLILRNSNAAAHSKITLGYDVTNSDILLETDGTGLVNIYHEGVKSYSLPNVVTTTNDYFLQAQTDGTTAWAAAAGGSNDFDVQLVGVELDASPGVGYAVFDILSLPPYGMARYTTGAVDTKQYFYPFIAPKTGDVSELIINITSVAATATNLYYGFYADNSGVPSSVLGYATFDATVSGSISTTAFSSTIALTRGTQYWVAQNKSTSESITQRSIQNDYVPRIAPSNSFPSTTNGYSVSLVTNSDVSATPAAITAAGLEPGIYFAGLGSKPHIGVKIT